jgi:hypothetical protein
MYQYGDGRGKRSLSIILLVDDEITCHNDWV